MSLLYRIGDVAEILGVTNEGVRFLERKGLLHSIRNPENGYRYYSRSELSAMQQVHFYSSAGFSLDEASDMVFKDGEHRLMESLRQKELQLDVEADNLRKKQAFIREQQDVIRKATSLNGDINVCGMPPLYYLPLEGKYAVERSKERLIAEKLWMSAMPKVMLAKLPLDRDGNPISGRGVCAKAEDAESLGLPMIEGVKFLPAGKCLSAYVSKPVGCVEVFDELYEKALEFGCRPSDDMLTAVLLSTVRNGQRSTISLVRLPVE